MHMEEFRIIRNEGIEETIKIHQKEVELFGCKDQVPTDSFYHIFIPKNRAILK